MYELITLVRLPKGNHENWIEENNNTSSLSTLYSNNEKILLNLKEPVSSKAVVLDLDKIKYSHISSDLTITDYLMQNGNKTLPTVSGHKTLESKQVGYVDAIRHGFYVTTTVKDYQNGKPNAGQPSWLVLRKAGLDYKTVYENTLVAMNGYLHATDYNPESLYLVDGVITGDISGKVEIGLLTFKSLGGILTFPFSETQITSEPNGSLYDHTVISTKHDLSQYSVAVSIAGHLHVTDHRTIYQVSDNSFSIDWNKIPLLARYFEDRSFIDLSSLELTGSSYNPDLIHAPEFKSDKVLRALLALSQSFVILIKNKNLHLVTDTIEKGPGPGLYYSYEKPTVPMLVGQGRFGLYWSVYEDGMWSLNLSDTRLANRSFLTTDQSRLENIDSGCVPAYPSEPDTESPAMWFRLSSTYLIDKP